MKFLTTEEAAIYATCSKKTIRTAVKDGRLTVAGRIGRRLRFTAENLDAFLQGNKL